MTRQRIRPSLKRSIFEDCPSCNSTGLVKTAESMAIEVIRMLLTTANHSETRRIVVEVQEKVADFLNNKKRKQLSTIEERFDVTLSINARTDVGPEHLRLRSLDEIGHEVKILKQSVSKS